MIKFFSETQFMFWNIKLNCHFDQNREYLKRNHILPKHSLFYFFHYLLIVIIISTLLTSCQTNRNEVFLIGKKTIMPSTSGKDVIMLYSDSSVLKIKLTTPQMQVYEKDVKEKMTIMPKGLFVIFYDDEGKQTTTLKANYGIRYEASKKMEVKYNVEVVNEKGEKLNTEHLVWDEQKKKITSDAFVKITTAKQIIMGQGLEANQDFTQYEIKEITGTIQLEDKP